MDTPKTQIPMEHPDGRPWTAESEVEAMELAAHGYIRLDGPATPAPAAGTRAPAGARSPAASDS